MVGDAADRVQRLEGRPGRDQTTRLRPAALGWKKRDQVLEQFGRLSIQAVTGLAAAWKPEAHAQV